MNLRTGNKRRRRRFWRRRGCFHLKASRGIWLRMSPEDAALGAQCCANGEEQPRFYRWYP